MKCESDLKTIINEAVRDGVKGAVLFIDLDDFKHINDGLGHQYGDILLQQIAAGLQSIVGLRGVLQNSVCCTHHKKNIHSYHSS
jgi:diguanylate cyclase (GGDEF)-like protein